jgi:hypothetical protein
VCDVAAASVEAVFLVEIAAREYVASQADTRAFSVESHALLARAPAPEFGLFARGLRTLAALTGLTDCCQ